MTQEEAGELIKLAAQFAADLDAAVVRTGGPIPIGSLIEAFAAGSSQDELAERCGLVKSQITKLKRGWVKVPAPVTARRLEAGTGIPSAVWPVLAVLALQDDDAGR